MRREGELQHNTYIPPDLLNPGKRKGKFIQADFPTIFIFLFSGLYNKFKFNKFNSLLNNHVDMLILKEKTTAKKKKQPKNNTGMHTYMYMAFLYLSAFI